MTRINRAAVAALSKGPTVARFVNITRIVLFSLILISTLFAADTGTSLTTTLTSVYCLLNGIVPIMAFTLFTLAGVAYGIGNFFGSEVRAKANQWAMSCITGAIIALLIIVFSNLIVSNLLGSTYVTPTCTATT